MPPPSTPSPRSSGSSARGAAGGRQRRHSRGVTQARRLFRALWLRLTDAVPAGEMQRRLGVASASCCSQRVPSSAHLPSAGALAPAAKLHGAAVGAPPSHAAAHNQTNRLQAQQGRATAKKSWLAPTHPANLPHTPNYLPPCRNVIQLARPVGLGQAAPRDPHALGAVRQRDQAVDVDTCRAGPVNNSQVPIDEAGRCVSGLSARCKADHAATPRLSPSNPTSHQPPASLATRPHSARSQPQQPTVIFDAQCGGRSPLHQEAGWRVEGVRHRVEFIPPRPQLSLCSHYLRRWECSGMYRACECRARCVYLVFVHDTPSHGPLGTLPSRHLQHIGDCRRALCGGGEARAECHCRGRLLLLLELKDGWKPCQLTHKPVCGRTTCLALRPQRTGRGWDRQAAGGGLTLALGSPLSLPPQ